MNRGAWWAPVHGVKRVRHDWSHLAQHSKFYKVKKKRKTESLASILSRGICIFGSGGDLLIGFQVHGWSLIGCNGTIKWSGDNFKKKRKGKWIMDTQSCPTLCDTMDYSLPGSSILGIFQARVLEWVAISFSRESSWSSDQTWVSCIVGRCFTIWATREVF